MFKNSYFRLFFVQNMAVEAESQLAHVYFFCCFIAFEERYEMRDLHCLDLLEKYTQVSEPYTAVVVPVLVFNLFFSEQHICVFLPCYHVAGMQLSTHFWALACGASFKNSERNLWLRINYGTTLDKKKEPSWIRILWYLVISRNQAAWFSCGLRAHAILRLRNFILHASPRSQAVDYSIFQGSDFMLIHDDPFSCPL